MLTKAKRRAGAFAHRIVRALRELGRSFRIAGRPTDPRRASSSPRRPNPWPRCIACHRHVAELCEGGCGVCRDCCAGHDDDTADPERTTP